MLRCGVLAVSLLLFASGPAFAQVEDQSRLRREGIKLFDAVWEAVRDRFYDPNFNGVDWKALRGEYLPRVVAARSSATQAGIISEMLSRLNASHTELLTPQEPRYYRLLNLFAEGHLSDLVERRFVDGRVRYTGIGVFLTRIDGKTFVKGVWAGFPAEQAGLRVGDEILSAGGKPFGAIDSFAGKAGQAVKLRIQSSPDAGSARDVTVIPAQIEPNEAFLTAQTNSFRIERRDGMKIGYLHIWSYAGEVYHALLVEMVTAGPLKNADALIVDLREGLGGARPKYLNLFNRNVPVLRMIGRDGSVRNWDRQWRKPAALLVNEGTTSGKEAFAYGFKKHRIGTIVGTRTAGAVLAGSVFPMPGDNLLYLAVADVTVDGERLEGVGVTPDVVVPFDLPYCGGKDPQLERAIELLAEEVRAKRRREP